MVENDSNKAAEYMQKGQQYSIKYISGDLNADDLYAVPNKANRETDAKVKEKSGHRQVGRDGAVEVAEAEPEDEEEKGKQEDIEGVEDKDANKDLPPGWEKHEDNDGPYYWHIKSGTIQREPPVWPKEAQTTPKELKTPVISPHPNQFLVTMRSPMQHQYRSNAGAGRTQECHQMIGTSVTRSSTSMALDQEEERRRKEEIAYK